MNELAWSVGGMILTWETPKYSKINQCSVPLYCAYFSWQTDYELTPRKKIHSSEASSLFAGQDIVSILWILKVHYRIHKSSPLALVLNQRNHVMKFSQI